MITLVFYLYLILLHHNLILLDDLLLHRLLCLDLGLCFLQLHTQVLVLSVYVVGLVSVLVAHD